jgi:hypothetical protein
VVEQSELSLASVDLGVGVELLYEKAASLARKEVFEDVELLLELDL